MAEISATVVMKLRKMSGQGMMDCKKALLEADGQIDKAMIILRKKGLVTLQKRIGRETSQGRIICKKSQDERTVAMVALCCETDFVANSDDFSACRLVRAGTLSSSGPSGRLKRPYALSRKKARCIMYQNAGLEALLPISGPYAHNCRGSKSLKL